MIIRRLTIKNFGKIHDKDMEFSPGINVLYGENESGKTTTHTFIKSMFYGLSRHRGRGAKNDPYSTYEPWENPGDYGGTLWFENMGKNFRITRNFQKQAPYGELLWEDTGELFDVEKGALDEALGNISEVIYDNTVSVAQLKSVTGQDLVRELKNYMASYQGTGDSRVDLGRAMQMLKMWRKGYQTQKDRQEKEEEKQQEKLAANMAYLRKEMDQLSDRRSDVDEQEASLQTVISKTEGSIELDEKLQSIGKKRGIIITGMVTIALVTFILIIGGGLLFGRFSFVRWLLVLAGCLAVGGGFILEERLKREIGKWTKLRARVAKKQEKLKWDKESLKASYEEKETAYTNLEKEFREYEAQAFMPTSQDLEIRALNLAMETIENISENIHRQVGGRLQRRTSQILREITGGKYQEVLMDEEFHLWVNTKERAVPAQRLSRGTLEQIYFALRMAAGELLCKKQVYPVILDDIFGMYDQERLAAVLHWLEKEKRQVIISTCHKREMEILEKEGIPYQKILLS